MHFHQVFKQLHLLIENLTIFALCQINRVCHCSSKIHQGFCSRASIQGLVGSSQPGATQNILSLQGAGASALVWLECREQVCVSPGKKQNRTKKSLSSLQINLPWSVGSLRIWAAEADYIALFYDLHP